MRQIVLNAEPYSADQIPAMLEARGIRFNRYAEEYVAHPLFSAGYAAERAVTIASLHEIGFENGATLDELFRRIPEIGLKPCSKDTALFLRLAWTDQPQSRSSVLTGTHESPDQAVVVLSEILEQNDAFPKGLYLRNVDGTLWLRGYVCDAAYRVPPDAIFAFESAAPGLSER